MLLWLVLCALLPASSADLELSSRVSGDVVVFTLAARTRGYIAVGFSLNGRLPGSDILVGWVDDSSGEGRILDCHGVEGRSSPQKDSTQNYKLLKAKQNETHTVIKVSRPWDTCDRKGDVVLVNDTMRLIWTVSEEDPRRFGWDAIEWSGPKSFHIGSSIHQEDLVGHKFWDVIAQDFTLPTDKPSFHWCKIYKVPQLSKKHHIIGYKPIVEDGHSALVAKMVFYECLGGPQFEVFGSHPGAPCHDTHTPKEWTACHTPVIVWATGSQGQLLPQHIGLPMAEGEGKSTYFMLEIHYDNPAMQRVRDNSGLRLFYSSELRKYDSSILATGITPTGVHIIPPKQIKFMSRAYCDNQCTNLMFPETGIKIVSVGFHTHSAGRQVRLRHIREGKELQIIAEDKNFDPGYQQPKKLPEEIIVLPGDDLVTECSYTTLNRTRLTLGGHAVKEEICMAYLLYYPRTALASCTSMTPVDFFFQTFGIKAFYNQNMEEVEKILLKQSEKRPAKHPKPPTQSLFFRFSEKQGFNIDVKKPYINLENDEENIFSDLIIEKPEEFQNRSFMSHLKDLPWSETLFTQRVEEIFNQGKFRTFCRLQDSTPAMPSGIYNFPNVSFINSTRSYSSCRKERGDGSFYDNSSGKANCSLYLVFVAAIFYHIFAY
ncbi:MOXD1 homolog 1 [Halyomorpha halys]|uniref:MOXD1 homolog 1 n=1 Tax=Halyomorpha halys TaxID=286706 RepID=UPI0006D4E94C|nr:MOXD1 homolog 1-like [Halyomorpha halys]